MDKDLLRDYRRYEKLCEKHGEKPIDKNEFTTKGQVFLTWLEHYNELLVKEDIHYNR